jgi:hypothetical protein
LLTISKVALAAAAILTAASSSQAADHEDQSGGSRVGPEGQRQGASAQTAPRGLETEGRGGAIELRQSGENPAFDRDRQHDNGPQDKGTDEKKK